MKTKSVKKLIQDLNKKGMITPGQAEKQDTHARDQAKAQLESIKEMVKTFNLPVETEEDERRKEDAEQTIQEDALEVEIRSVWHAPGESNVIPGEFYILLCTGGPAVRIIGTLSEHTEPERAHLEYQDWGTPWTEYRLTVEEETVLAYCRCFYFGE